MLVVEYLERILSSVNAISVPQPGPKQSVKASSKDGVKEPANEEAILGQRRNIKDSYARVNSLVNRH